METLLRYIIKKLTIDNEQLTITEYVDKASEMNRNKFVLIYS
jgi:hypothetical protein